MNYIWVPTQDADSVQKEPQFFPCGILQPAAYLRPLVAVFGASATAESVSESLATVAYLQSAFAAFDTEALFTLGFMVLVADVLVFWAMSRLAIHQLNRRHVHTSCF